MGVAFGLVINHDGGELRVPGRDNFSDAIRLPGGDRFVSTDDAEANGHLVAIKPVDFSVRPWARTFAPPRRFTALDLLVRARSHASPEATSRTYRVAGPVEHRSGTRRPLGARSGRDEEGQDDRSGTPAVSCAPFSAMPCSIEATEG